ncbi:ribosomal protein L11 methyltransferase [Clostridium sp. CAG:411]|nr:50S ribosomal protein L11 methyltransferase [Lachnospiraceae bacterium]CDE43135.1 ribosomal protein L11 methyltransferase [Clostridium sp. CAG:411]
MKYTKVSLKTTTEAVDFISNLFDEIGLEGIQIEDNIPLSEEDKKAMYIDILPELPEDDGTAIVSSYFDPANFEVPQLQRKIEEGLKELSLFINIGEGTLQFSDTDDKDWLNNWKEFFKPFRVADDIIIKPTWEELPEHKEGDLVIEIDPGIAFGTGAHETTKLCILGLRKYITSDTQLLDVGCGSGILSIIGLKLGAKHALGTDIDEHALEATKENIVVNHIAGEQFDLLAGNIISEEEIQQKVGMKKYDVVVANILADIIIPLSGEIMQHMKEDGVFISSGILNTKADEVQDALLKNGFKIIEKNEMGDWVSFVATPETNK